MGRKRRKKWLITKINNHWEIRPPNFNRKIRLPTYICVDGEQAIEAFPEILKSHS